MSTSICQRSRRTPRTTLFPYTTLFRSGAGDQPVRCTQDCGANRYHRRRVAVARSEEHTSELQSLTKIVCRLLLEKKNGPAASPARRQTRRPWALDVVIRDLRRYVVGYD